MACDRLLQHEIAEDCRVDGRRVLQKDRVCRGGQLGGQNQQYDQTDIGKDGSDLKAAARQPRTPVHDQQQERGDQSPYSGNSKPVPADEFGAYAGETPEDRG